MLSAFLVGDEAIGAVAFGNALIKRAAGDLEIIAYSFASTMEYVLGRILERIGKRAARNLRGGRIAVNYASCNTLRMSPFDIRRAANKLSTGNRRITIIENSTSVALRRHVAQLELATVDGKRVPSSLITTFKPPECEPLSMVSAPQLSSIEESVLPAVAVTSSSVALPLFWMV